MKNKDSVREYVQHIKRDLFIVFLSAVAAYFLTKTGVIGYIISLAEGYVIIASFIAGLFFTTIFTVAPAIVALALLAHSADPLVVALWGGFGAMLVDSIIFLFLRDKLYADLGGLLKIALKRKLLSVFHFGLMKWVVLFAGAFVIASPLPDEIGLALLGLSKVKLSILLPILFIFNSVGIYIIVTLSRAAL
jgi:hypothetical protein